MTKKFHFIGIGGIGMSGLARILLEKKALVSGSDRSPSLITEELGKMGAAICSTHAKENVSCDMSIVYSSDVPSHNPEYQAALQWNCPVLHRSDLLAELMKGYTVLAIAGTHGKTTTTALMTSVLKESGLDPTFAVGGILKQYETNAALGKGPFFVAEADESDGTFLKYDPDFAIITNIGKDHLSHYGDEAALIKAFKTFAEKTKNLFYCGDDERLSKLSLKGVSYGFSEHCLLRASNARQEGWENVFDITFNGRLYRQVEVSLIGKHNVLNALAVFGLALTLGVPEEQIRSAFRRFAGTKRRQEKKWEERNILFLDDYAHHPTEIRTTLQGIKEAVKGRRLIAVYQPHRYTRIKDCLGSFSSIFDAADELIITDLYSAGETPIPGISHEPIVSEVTSLPVCYVPRAALAAHLFAKAAPHDVIVTLGAGDITKLSQELHLKMLS